MRVVHRFFWPLLVVNGNPTVEMPGLSLRIRRGQKAEVDDPVWKLRSLDQPIDCENAFFHAVPSDQYEVIFPELFKRRQLEWLPPEDCYISIFPSDPNSYHIDDNADVHYKYESLVALNQMARSGYLRPARWLMYSDLAVIPLNQKLTIQRLVSRLDNSLATGNDTTETRLCDMIDPFYCSSRALAPTNITSFDAVALTVPLDIGCNNSTLFNTGVLLGQPSRLLGLIGAAMFTVATPDEIPNKAKEKQRLKYIFQELFEVPLSQVERFCGAPRIDLWEASTPSIYDSNKGTELFMLRRFDLDKALRHPSFHQITQIWFPDGRLWPGEPDTLAIVNNRWMASPACKVANNLETFRKPLLLRCGDMFAHFEGCHPKAKYKSLPFRQLVTAAPECVKLLPFHTNDDGSKPFDLEFWLNSSISSYGNL
eukprot:Protomagalhaensia_wolfi_Nauph_80__2873@NODE_296_length_2867_cov_28_449788_g221_i0_p2_GENE_NODE_296_length_2867_cov_28_449788_g221_i0NODE_296_length_2867_cov_28_449788_g221_i0_p2_ORF_typecomplete_len425_score44_88_NODE_296_length_2867_cov_28_449788_g221_i015162790